MSPLRVARIECFTKYLGKASGSTGLESRMKESYRENLASSSGHKHYAGSGDAPGVAWASGDAGQPREDPEKDMALLCLFSYISRGKTLVAMKRTPEDMSALAREVAQAEANLQNLELEIAEIGQPAAHELKRRFDALKIEEKALKRNLAEALGMQEPDSVRMKKIEALLHSIQREEASVEHDAHFLHQSPPTSAELAVQAGARLVELCQRALKRLLGNRHPLGMSVFVNQSPASLATRYGLADGCPRTRNAS
jgi:hypothetical protein